MAHIPRSLSSAGRRAAVVAVAVTLAIGLLPASAMALDLGTLLQGLLATKPAAAPVPAPVPAPEAPSIPPLPEGSGDGRRIVYSVSRQRVWLVEEGNREVDGWQVSGHVGFPPAGTYQVFSKSRTSTAGSLKLEYMVRFFRASSGKAVGFHSIPTRNGVPIQSEEQLGSFTSAGCVRQQLDDAATLWAFAPEGTTVVVTP